MGIKLNWIACRLTLPVGLLLLSACASVPQAVAVECAPRPVLPVELAREPPREGAGQACLQELSRGQILGQACNYLRSWSTN